jgi:hypothetical protein
LTFNPVLENSIPCKIHSYYFYPSGSRMRAFWDCGHATLAGKRRQAGASLKRYARKEGSHLQEEKKNYDKPKTA